MATARKIRPEAEGFRPQPTTAKGGGVTWDKDVIMTRAFCDKFHGGDSVNM